MHEAWRMFCKMKDWQDSFPSFDEIMASYFGYSM
jgi:hypothetical protein